MPSRAYKLSRLPKGINAVEIISQMRANLVLRMLFAAILREGFELSKIIYIQHESRTGFNATYRLNLFLNAQVKPLLSIITADRCLLSFSQH